MYKCAIHCFYLLRKQIFGGWLAERFGAKLAFLTSVACLSIFTLMIPVAAHRGPELLFAVRLLMGLTHVLQITHI